MVVFENGKPLKSDYRKYKIRGVEAPDDYAYMAEVLKRRYGKGEASEPYPDLLMVDGGKGQLNIAVAVLAELGLAGKFDVLSIAKKDEKQGETEDKIYKPGRANPLNMGRERDLLGFLQQIRDEAHRFVITFHREHRTRTTLASGLDGLAGVGIQRKKALITHFGSMKKIRAATLDELRAVPGISAVLADTIFQAFRQNPE
jgi:excinuclease ABC subunit C